MRVEECAGRKSFRGAEEAGERNYMVAGAIRCCIILLEDVDFYPPTSSSFFFVFLVGFFFVSFRLLSNVVN